MSGQHKHTGKNSLIIKNKIKNILGKDFNKSVLVLAGGTALTQILMVLALPILTRIYTPEQFNVLAVYVAVVAIISVAACLRFEIAIPIAEHDVDAANLLAVSLGLAAIIGLICAIVVLQAIEHYAFLNVNPLILPYLWLIPIGIWLSGSYSALQFWATRKKRFKIITETRITQSIGGIATQIGIGLIIKTTLGLILGQILSNCAGIVKLMYNAAKTDSLAMRGISFQNMRRVFVKYDRFPKYSALESVVNSASSQFPIVLIAVLSAGHEAGFLILASKVMMTPMGLIGNSIGQVYLSKIADEHRNGRLGQFTASIIVGLVKIGVLPILLLGLASPTLFPVVFGGNWDRAGAIVLWMTPWLILQFVTSPISMALHVSQNQHTALVLQVFGFILRVGAVLFATYIMQHSVAEAYAVSGLIFYLVYFLVILKTIKINLKMFNFNYQP
jgi:O-antigen/teichoic acid export membrane protein